MAKKIIYNLEDFAKAVVDFISNGTKEGQRRLERVYKAAKKQYLNEEHPFWAWFTNLTRHRGEDFDKSIEEIGRNSDPIIRLQEFKKFISEGEWELTSANTRLLIHMIRAIKGYENSRDSVSAKYLHRVVVEPLKTLIIKDIDALIAVQERALKKKELEEKKLEERRIKREKKLNEMVISDNELNASNFAKENPTKQVFYLSYLSATSKWQLKWYDLTGKPNSLNIQGELAKLLESLENPVLPESNSIKLSRIKEECEKLIKPRLAKVGVLIDPELLVEPSFDSQRSTSVYAITRKDNEFQLKWYDSIGGSQPIPLQDYPLLAEWLKDKNRFSKEDLVQLKTYLQHVSVRRDVVKNSQVEQALVKKHGVSLITTNDIQKIPRYRLIPGTYFLTREPDSKTGAWVLYQKVKGEEKLRKIDTEAWDSDSWELFHGILTKNDASSAADLANQLSLPYEPCLVTKETLPDKDKLEKNKLYIYTIAGLLYYTVITPVNKPKTDQISKRELNYEIEGTLKEEQLNTLLTEILKITTKRGDTLSVAEEIRNCIMVAERNMIKKLPNCVSVNDFDPQKSTDYSTGTFIVTKQDEQWKLYYIDIWQKAISVDLNAVDNLASLFKSWAGEPSTLAKQELGSLAELVSTYHPVSRIDIANFSELESCLSNSRKTAENEKEKEEELSEGEPSALSSNWKTKKTISFLESFFAQRKPPAYLQDGTKNSNADSYDEAEADDSDASLCRVAGLFKQKSKDKNKDLVLDSQEAPALNNLPQ